MRTVIFDDDLEPDFASDGWTSGVSGTGSVTNSTEQARSPTNSVKAYSTGVDSLAYLWKDFTTPASGKFTFAVGGYLPAALGSTGHVHLVTPAITTDRLDGWIGPHVFVAPPVVYADGKSLAYYSGGYFDTGYDVPIAQWFVTRVVVDFADNRCDIYCDAQGGKTLRKADAGLFSNMAANTTYSLRPGVYSSYNGMPVTVYFDDLGYATHEWFGARFYQAVAEILGMVDSAPRKAAFKQSVSEILGMVDSAAKQKSMYQTISEVLGMADSVPTKAAFKQTISEVLGLADSATRSRGFPITISEVLGIRDGLEARKHVGRLGDLPDHYREGGA